MHADLDRVERVLNPTDPWAAGMRPGVLAARLDQAVVRTAEARARLLGFPAATDLDFTPTAGLLAGLVNNLGDPETRTGRWPVHVQDLEREVIAACLDLFGGSPGTCWGYVTAGGSTGGVLHGLWLGRERFPEGARVYASTAAHYCVAKAAGLLGLPLTWVDTDPVGRMRPDRLGAATAAHRDRAALVVATVGTTMTEAVDDLPAVHAALDAAGIIDRHVVVDAALSGPMLAVPDPTAASSMGNQVGVLLAGLADTRGGPTRGYADTVCISGHKFLGTPLVCGIALSRRAHLASIEQVVDLIGARDVTIAGSRSGLAVAQLWWVLHHLGRDGLRARARQARAVAARAVTALAALGWRAWRHDHACTVVIDPPPEPIAARWALPVVDGVSHVVCVPGVSDARIDRFVAELAVATGRRPLPPTPPPSAAPACDSAVGPAGATAELAPSPEGPAS